MTDYSKAIQNPPESGKGLTRWWWYGCAVTEEEIERQLQFMYDAGIGGVEIQILYPTSRDDRKKGIQNIPYFSPAFFAVLKYTARSCKELGMSMDFTPGSSWPFGGPPINEDYAMQQALPYHLDIMGPCGYSHDFTTQLAGDVCAASLGRMQDCSMDAESVQDVTGNFSDKYLFGWPWGTQIEDLKVPAGPHKLTMFVVNRYRQPVLKPAPNAAGMVLDHCSREAFDYFAENMLNPVTEKLGEGTVGSFFCDSIECDGHNWSGVLLEEFKKRRGYALEPYLYALWGDMGACTGDIRYDYFHTMSELTVENFFQRFTEWCHSRHITSRIQAHGTWGDILQAYGAADIPEGETFGDHRTLECNTIHRRLAASAGHLYGKKIISNESFTWLKVPRYSETPQDLKAAVDAIFLDGMNMIVNHGYSYSPAYAEGNGWPFYASCNLNHTESWWPKYSCVGKYIQSVSAMLRRGEPVVKVGIYLPTADVWAESLLSDIHLAMRLEEHIGRQVADRINKAGYWFDYLNDEALCSLGHTVDGGVRIGENTYQTILLIGCTRMPLETADRLLQFVEAGGVLLADVLPYRGCGLKENESEGAAVQKLFQALFSGKTGKGKALKAPDKEQELLALLAQHVTPDLKIEKNQSVGYVHRREAEADLYFLSNISSCAESTALEFSDVKGALQVYSAETGEILPVEFYERSGSKAVIRLRLEAYSSAYVVFSHNDSHQDILMETERALRLVGEVKDWELSVNGRAYPKTPNPVFWNEGKGLEWYSGEGCYSADFDYVPENSEERLLLKFEQLECAATVRINGKLCGDLWKLPYQLPINGMLANGKNHIEVFVYSSSVNKMIDPSVQDELDPLLIEEWPYFGEVINHQKRSRTMNTKERAYYKAPQPSGMAGCVRLYRIE